MPQQQHLLLDRHYIEEVGITGGVVRDLFPCLIDLVLRKLVRNTSLRETEIVDIVDIFCHFGEFFSHGIFRRPIIVADVDNRFAAEPSPKNFSIVSVAVGIVESQINCQLSVRV